MAWGEALSAGIPVVSLIILVLLLLGLWEWHKKSIVRECDRLDVRIPHMPPSDPLPLKGVGNFRDIGQIYQAEIPGHPHVHVKKNCIFRTSAPVNVSPEDQQFLLGTLKVKAMLDIRMVQEERKFPLSQELLHNTVYHRIPLINGRAIARIGMQVPAKNACVGVFEWLTGRRKEALQTLWGGINAVEMYVILIDRCKSNFAKIFQVVLDCSNYPMMLFCSAGKDRTGLTVAMVLSLLGVKKELICSEFGLSIAFYETGNIRGEPSAFKASFKSEAMFTALTYLERKYGSVPAYLDRAGFPFHSQSALRRNLLHYTNED